MAHTHLAGYGWRPGTLTLRCDCGAVFAGAKGSRRCVPCAKALSERNAPAPSSPPHFAACAAPADASAARRSAELLGASIRFEQMARQGKWGLERVRDLLKQELPQMAEMELNETLVKIERIRSGEQKYAE